MTIDVSEAAVAVLAASVCDKESCSHTANGYCHTRMCMNASVLPPVFVGCAAFRAAAMLRELRRQLSECERDADRYRWLRQFAGQRSNELTLPDPTSPENFDALIDVAIAAKETT